MVAMDTVTAAFEAERARLVRIAGRILDDDVEAHDIVQRAWLRLQGTDDEIASLPAWLTTVTTRLCLDRLRANVPVPEEELELAEHVADPAEDLAQAEAVGIALGVVLDRLTPTERVAFVLHDSFGVDFSTIAAILDTTPAAARKLASRARGKVVAPAPDARADWEVVDAFLAAARAGEFARLLELLAPDVVVIGDAAAVSMGTPARIAGRDEVAQFFNGAAKTALPAFVGDRPGAAWALRGETKVAFDFTVIAGAVTQIAFCAEPAVLVTVRTRKGAEPVGPLASD